MNRKTRKANKMENKRVLLFYIESLEKAGLGLYASRYKEMLKHKRY